MQDLALAIERNVGAALEEDVGGGDLTAQLIPATARARAHIITRSETVICGAAWVEATFRRLDPQVEIHWFAAEGSVAPAGQIVCTLRGDARALLTGERTALNFLQLLSRCRDHHAPLRRRRARHARENRRHPQDPARTAAGAEIRGRHRRRHQSPHGPVRRHADQGKPHRRRRRNHRRLREAARHAPAAAWIQIEVENLDQLREALAAGAKMILLDNMSTAQMREAVALTAGRAELEASGGITLANVRAIAETGVDRISIGGLTKDVKAVDLSMRFDGLSRR